MKETTKSIVPPPGLSRHQGTGARRQEPAQTTLGGGAFAAFIRCQFGAPRPSADPLNTPPATVLTQGLGG